MSGGIEQYVVGRVIGKGSFGEVCFQHKISLKQTRHVTVFDAGALVLSSIGSGIADGAQTN
jgi:hypothetical protein